MRYKDNKLFFSLIQHSFVYGTAGKGREPLGMQERTRMAGNGRGWKGTVATVDRKSVV
jgi:hypothetical protein